MGEQWGSWKQAESWSWGIGTAQEEQQLREDAVTARNVTKVSLPYITIVRLTI